PYQLPRSHREHRDLHSFPTRRSSDLAQRNVTTIRSAIALAATAQADRREPRAAATRATTNPSPSAFDDGASASSISSRAIAMSGDRKSTRLNSSHDQISYAVFCLKKN